MLTEAGMYVAECRAAGRRVNAAPAAAQHTLTKTRTHTTQTFHQLLLAAGLGQPPTLQLRFQLHHLKVLDQPHAVNGEAPGSVAHFAA